MPDAQARGAAFFDLDRTLIRRSSMLALAPSLRRHGLIGWGSLARATAWHAIYLVRGVSSRQLDAGRGPDLPADEGLAGRRAAAADRRGDRAARRARVPRRDRAHARPSGARRAGHRRLGLADRARRAARATPRPRRSHRLACRDAGREVHRQGRLVPARAGQGRRRARLRGGARHRPLPASSAYTDSRSDIQLLEAVGHPYAVNPDRALAKAASARGWPVLHFSSGGLALAEAEAALLLESKS